MKILRSSRLIATQGAELGRHLVRASCMTAFGATYLLDSTGVSRFSTYSQICIESTGHYVLTSSESIEAAPSTNFYLFCTVHSLHLSTEMVVRRWRTVHEFSVLICLGSDTTILPFTLSMVKWAVFFAWPVACSILRLSSS